jgi:hypothetical protein
MQVAEKNDGCTCRTSARPFSIPVVERADAVVRAAGGFRFSTFNLSGRGEPEQYTGNAMSPSLLPLLGLNAVAGRGFTDEEDRPGAAPWR